MVSRVTALCLPVAGSEARESAIAPDPVVCLLASKVALHFLTAVVGSSILRVLLRRNFLFLFHIQPADLLFLLSLAMQHSLRVMTFNIRVGNAPDGPNDWFHRKPLCIATIASANPDILCVQEAMRFQMDDLRAAFPQYWEWGGARDDGLAGGEYSSILYLKDRFVVNHAASSTFWLSETPLVPGSKSWGCACPRIATCVHFTEILSNTSFVVCNTHLDHESATARSEGMKLIWSHLVKTYDVDIQKTLNGVGSHGNGGCRSLKQRLIIAGDWNCTPDEEPVQFLQGQQMRDALAGWPDARPLLPQTATVGAVASTVAVGGTYHGFQGLQEAPATVTTAIPVLQPRIDYIAVARGWNILRCYIDRTSSSSGGSGSGMDGKSNSITCAHIQQPDQQIDTAQATGLRRYPSDHYPVVAELSLAY